jgi:hypothetical protein
VVVELICRDADDIIGVVARASKSKRNITGSLVLWFWFLLLRKEARSFSPWFGYGTSFAGTFEHEEKVPWSPPSPRGFWPPALCIS